MATKWKAHLCALEADPPGPLVSIISTLARALGVRDTLAIYEDKVAKARAAIERCRKNDAVLTAYINDPERKRKYDEWMQWPEHRERVKAHEATLPDAPRPNPVPGPEDHSVTPSSTCNGPFALTPHQTPKVPEPW